MAIRDKLDTNLASGILDQETKDAFEAWYKEQNDGQDFVDYIDSTKNTGFDDTYYPAYQDYVANVYQQDDNPLNGGEDNGGSQGEIPTYTTPTVAEGSITQITPHTPDVDTQISIEDYAGQIAHDPQLAFSDDALLSNKDFDYEQAQVDAGLIADQADTGSSTFNASTETGTASIADQVDPRDAATYDADRMFDEIDSGVADVTAAQGSVSAGAEAEAGQSDVEGHATGDTELGKALQDFAFLDPSNVDARATLKGQIDVLQEEFVDSDGNPTIPAWASAAARNVQKIAAFKGITGTAATAALSQAIMESSIQIAEQDAKFFQTLTLTNLNNQQQSTLQRASILSKMDMANADMRTAVAISNSKNFLQMDLANLDNEQQAEVLNAQARIQALLEDTRQENIARQFGADAENDMNQFYSALEARLNEFNASQLNAMEQFNVDEANSINQFNSELEDSRDKFYREMSYAVDLANAEWRQDITTQEKQMEFEAAAFDARNMVDMTAEQLSQLWDRADALLDYIWKSGENDLDRNTELVLTQMRLESAEAIAQINAETQKDLQDSREAAASKAGWGNFIGTIAADVITDLF